MKVLVIDPSPIGRQITRRFLASIGHDVHSQTAYDVISAGTHAFVPDVALIDIDLPVDPDTAACISLLQEQMPEKPRIVLQGSLSPRKLHDTMQRLGAHACIPKPLDGAAFFMAFCAAAGIMPVAMSAPASDEDAPIPPLPEALRLGVPWVDAQHALLYHSHRRFMSVPSERLRDETRALLGFLEAYAAFHFAAEEALIATDGPDARAHRSEHRAFLGTVRRFHHALELAASQVDVPKRVEEFVTTWVESHINGSDRTLFA